MDVMDASSAIADEDALIEKWIEPDPDRGGRGEFRLKEYCVHVWALIGYYRGLDHDATKVADAFDIPVEAVEAAIAYYERHRILIDDRIAANGG